MNIDTFQRALFSKKSMNHQQSFFINPANIVAGHNLLFEIYHLPTNYLNEGEKGKLNL